LRRIEPLGGHRDVEQGEKQGSSTSGEFTKEYNVTEFRTTSFRDDWFTGDRVTNH
jgi:hypothetical protein